MTREMGGSGPCKSSKKKRGQSRHWGKRSRGDEPLRAKLKPKSFMSVKKMAKHKFKEGGGMTQC